jgi:mannose-1-phosphate guanylyltransferase
MAGEEGDHEYGWILPALRPSAGVRPVLSFVEKPDPETSRGLASDGALVNSFIFACRGRTLVRLFEDTVPDLARVMVSFVLAGSPQARLRHLYDEIPTLDFSRAVLERAPGSLGVLAVPPCGWSDLGTPSRLESFLGRARVGRAAQGAAAAVG